jgi:hypothetical protein
VGWLPGIARPLRSGRFGAFTLAVALSCAGATAAATAPGAIAQPETLQIGGNAPVQAIKPGFLGLSLEYWAVLPYTGYDSKQINPVFLQLIRNLNPGQAPSLRIGGDSTDRTWWPVRGVKKPGGVKYVLTKRWLAAAGALTHDLGARVILGINLEANSTRIARAEADHFISGIGRQSIDALEPGNEPELYGSWTYYRHRGRKVFARPLNYSFGDFEREFSRFHRVLGSVPLAGPTAGSVRWMKPLGGFLSNEPGVSLASLHRYPLQRCFISPNRPQYPTIAHLLSPNSSRGLANSVLSSVKVAHAHHLPIRIDELNSNGCGDASAVTESFASALWILDTVTAMANVGVDGVNVHTYPKSSYELFSFHRTNSGRWVGQVSPEYYGLLMFTLAAPPGSQPLSLSGDATSHLSTWATYGPDGQTRVLLINTDPAQTRTVAIDAGIRVSPAKILRLAARSLSTHTGVTLAGGTFGTATDTGRLSGANRVDSATPLAGRYTVSAPPTSATLVVLPPNAAARDR